MGIEIQNKRRKKTNPKVSFNSYGMSVNNHLLNFITAKLVSAVQSLMKKPFCACSGGSAIMAHVLGITSEVLWHCEENSAQTTTERCRFIADL